MTQNWKQGKKITLGTMFTYEINIETHIFHYKYWVCQYVKQDFLLVILALLKLL